MQLGVANLYKVGREVLDTERKPEGCEALSLVDMWRKSMPGTRNKYKGPEVGGCLACLRNSKEAGLAKDEGTVGKVGKVRQMRAGIGDRPGWAYRPLEGL